MTKKQFLNRLDEAKKIYAEGPKFDLGLDAEYYIAKGFIEGHAVATKEAIEFFAGEK